jgi:putative ABC transport system ATP-binding protein
MKPLVVIENLGKVFRLGKRTVTALSGISFTINRGEYLSIMGPSGSGKSTLFNMIGALDRPSSGEVRVGGIELGRLDQGKLAYFRSHYIGYIFQSYNLIAAYSALLNVALPLIFCGMGRDDAFVRAEQLLKDVGLGNRLENRPDQLSGGQQQRVAIARALVNNPLIILADEPTANLDFKTGEEMIELLAQLCRERGTTVISATHDHKMLACSDRILWIRDGRVDRIVDANEAAVEVGSIV